MITSVRNAIIPALNTFCGVPVIEADQSGKKPDGPHATYKFTATIKDVGQAEEVMKIRSVRRMEGMRVTISFTAIDKDIDTSMSLAEKMADWFNFYGVEVLDSNNIVVIDKTSIQNRDTFLIDEYERQNGFDVILRVTKEISKDIQTIEKVEVNDEYIEVVEINP